MERQNKGLMVIVAILAVTVLGMAVGFAALASTLNIQGNATIEPAKWEVRYKNSSSDGTTGTYFTDNSKLAIQQTSPRSNATSLADRTTAGTTKLLVKDPEIDDYNVTFDAHLYEIDDELSFDVTVINKGDYDAQLSTVDMALTNTTTTDKSTNLNYLKYTITYDGNTYTIDETNKTNPLKETVTANSVIIKSGEEKTLTVTLKYVQPTNSTDLPIAIQTVQGTASLYFVPKTA